ncbi:hypothetical protein [Flavobacterium columnare]|uniref:hypothetical protein n=1 Tax=Flavobacterium columnare TaxID=996 RepID=UPI002989E013|nr:hypothetical protein [Flavobacterium columnare]MCH4828968.1 hypothetical protein [Flavobacterium columnare]
MNWKPEIKDNPEKLTNIDFDAFYRLGKKDIITMEDLSKWVDIYSSSPNFNVVYKFTPEDLKRHRNRRNEIYRQRIKF